MTFLNPKILYTLVAHVSRLTRQERMSFWPTCSGTPVCSGPNTLWMDHVVRIFPLYYIFRPITSASQEDIPTGNARSQIVQPLYGEWVSISRVYLLTATPIGSDRSTFMITFKAHIYWFKHSEFYPSLEWLSSRPKETVSTRLKARWTPFGLYREPGKIASITRILLRRNNGMPIR